MVPLQILGGRYRLEKVVGAGGMSIVWRAQDELLDRAVAVKILAGDFTIDHARAAVLAEAQAVARLSHANICTVFDYGESPQPDGDMVPYIVMELLDGPSLHDRLEQGPLALPEALKIAAEVASGLAAAHAQGVVHRDVKPGNVILTSSGAKIIDFGIATLAGSPEAGPNGVIPATLAFVAPERLLGGIVLAPSDMFGWGIVLFRLLTGRMPWPPWAKPEDRLSLAAPLPVMQGIPATMGDLFLSCLAEDPHDRPTANAAAAVVRVALTVRTPQPSLVAPPFGLRDDDTASVTLGAIADADRRRRRRRAVVLTAGLVAVLIGAVFAVRTKVDNRPWRRGRRPVGHTERVVHGGTPSVEVIGLPGPEVTVPGAPAPAVTVTMTVGGNQSVVVPATSFRTKGGRVVAVCDAYGPRVTDVVAEPGFYPNELSVIVKAWVFFTKPGAGSDPATTYRLTITCNASSEPKVTTTSYSGDRLVTPAAAAPATSAAPKSP